MKGITMRLRFSLIILSVFIFLSCSPVLLVKYPVIPQASSERVEFSIYDVPKVKFVAEQGTNPKRLEDITIEISDVAGLIDEEKISTTIKGPDNIDYKIGITPMLLVINITNNTDHIITLERTIIKIEDDNQQDYPLIVNVKEAKEELIKTIIRAFDDYYNRMDDHLKASLLNNETYNKDFNKFKDEVMKHLKSRYRIKTTDSDANLIIKRKGVKVLLNQISPKYLYQDNLRPYKERVELLKRAAIQKVNEDIEVNVTNIITNGVYLPISLIPGREIKIVVPFNVRKKGERINSLFIRIFDMPIKVDAAGNPIKRDHFNFKLNSTI